MQHFYCLCDGGLGNRLNSLVSGMIIWKKASFGSKFVILWPLNRYCDAEIKDVIDMTKLGTYFDNDTDVILRVTDEIQMNCNHVLAHDRKGFNGKFTNLLKIISLRKFTNFQDLANGEIMFTTPLIPFCVKYKEVREIKQYLKPAPQIIDKLLALGNKVNKRSIALHLRGTDYGFSHRYFTFWYYLIKFLPLLKFHIFTDDKSIIDRFSKQKNTVFFNHTVLPEKYNSDASWTEMLLDEYNISRSKSAVTDGFIEMLFLAEMFKIITSRSTFLYNAFYFSKTKFNIGFFIIFNINRVISFMRIIR